MFYRDIEELNSAHFKRLMGVKGEVFELEVTVKLSGEMDEFWSFVQNKSNQRWTWYAIERKSLKILKKD